MNAQSNDIDGLQSFEPWPEADIHVEWGIAGARLASARGDLVVLVDVLSFSTSLSIACGRGATVFVYSPDELEAMGGRAKVGRDLEAEVITKSRRFAPGSYSLSPSSLSDCPAELRLLVTSLNGAAGVAAADSAPECVVGCLRNRIATAEYVAHELRNDSNSIRRATIVSCGEQWSSVKQEGGWRPCIEDWLGAGAIVDALRERGFSFSAEAELAMGSFQPASTRLRDVLMNCISGRELVARGFSSDVELAAEVDADARAIVRNHPEEREFGGE